jgi:tRNA threonylcarbamoyladenosine modification (KEOPS) complex  Pcc1 subunit
MKFANEARVIHEAILAAGDDVEVTFDKTEITFYWENLRIDVQAKDFDKALQVIKDAKALNARFE